MHYRSFTDVLFAKRLGRAVIRGFLSSPECEYSVSLCDKNVNAYCTLYDKLEFFHFCIFVISMLRDSFSVLNRCHCVKRCSDFFGDFHVVGTELIGDTMSSFKNKVSAQSAVCSQQIGGEIWKKK